MRVVGLMTVLVFASMGIDAGAQTMPAVYRAPDCSTEAQPDLAPFVTAFARTVQTCWVVDSGDPASLVSVMVGFEMTRSGHIKPDTLILRHAKGGDPAAIQRAFLSVRRALLRCQGADGYDLPAEHYAQWSHVEMCFSSPMALK